MSELQAPHDAEKFDIAADYARIFGSAAGQRIARHLRSITIERTIGPDASDALLRHVEGQRQLVSYMFTLAARGRQFSTVLAESTTRTENAEGE